MATRFSPSSRSCAGDAVRPSIFAALRLPTSRCSRTESKTASTVARSAPGRPWSAPPRAPRARLSASMMSDLPLPVSPVRRLRPGPKRTVASATSARSRTASSRSILFGDEGPAPAQLLAEAAVEALRRAEANHLQAPGVRTAPHAVADGDGPPATCAIHAHLGRAADDLESHVLARGEDDRPHGQGKRAHGHEDQVFERGLENGTAACERVCRRAARRGYDGPVGI